MWQNKKFMNIGSPSFSINSAEFKSVLKGVSIAVGGAVATEITRQITGSNFELHWRAFKIGPFEFAAGVYSAKMLVWVGWSAFINFVRKFIVDNTQNPS